MSSSSIVDRVTDDVVIGGDSEQNLFIGDRYVLTPNDYILLALGARDYDYLVFENSRHVLDNECTSLFPLESHTILQFILFMVSHRFPRMAHLLDFQKHKKHGVWSNVVGGLVEAQNGKALPNLISERDFALLKMPPRFLITPHYTPYKKTGPIGSPYARLFMDNTGVLAYRDRTVGTRVDSITDLEHIFKTDVLFYLPRFYYHHYANIHGELLKKSSVMRTLGMATPADSEFGGRSLNSSVFSFTDRKKMHLKIQTDDDAIKSIHRNIKRFYEKIGQKGEIPPLEEAKKRYLGILNNPEPEPITAEREVHEFFLKSILLRRPPHSMLNTNTNRTNGIYLLKNGVARLRELVFMEILDNPGLLAGTSRSQIYGNPTRHGMMDHVHLTRGYVEVRYTDEGGKSRAKMLRMSDVVDMDSKPFLLKRGFMDLVDRIYGRHELHHILKYAQVYTRLFSGIGDRGVRLMLGVELPDWTGFSLARHIQRWGRWMREDGFVPDHKDFTFTDFERMMYLGLRGRPRAVGAPPSKNPLQATLWRLRDESSLYSAERARSAHKKLMGKDL